jgi:hypothetical protein
MMRRRGEKGEAGGAVDECCGATKGVLVQSLSQASSRVQS